MTDKNFLKDTTNYNVAIIQDKNIRVFRQTYDYVKNSSMEEVRRLLNPKPIIIGQYVFFYNSFYFFSTIQSEVYCKIREYGFCITQFPLV